MRHIVFRTVHSDRTVVVPLHNLLSHFLIPPALSWIVSTLV